APVPAPRRARPAERAPARAPRPRARRHPGGDRRRVGRGAPADAVAPTGARAPRGGIPAGRDGAAVILPGDVGGPQTRLALYDRGPVAICPETSSTVASSSLGEIVGRFLGMRPGSVSSACFGVAATVANGFATGVNLPWSIDARELAAVVGVETVGLVN